MNRLVIGTWSLVLASLIAAQMPARAQTCYGGFCYPRSQDSGARSQEIFPPGSRLLTPGSSLVPQAPQHHPAHCRVFVGDGSVGSGTLIARNDSTGLVLTCSHLFDQTATNVVVAFGDGSRYGARLIDRDPANDLAALLIKRPYAEPMEVDDKDLGEAMQLTACGFGSNGAFRPVRGTVSGMAQAVGAAYPSVKIAAAVRPGDSGGGVLDGAGRLVGVVWGCRDGETYFTCGQPLRQFLDRVWRGAKREERASSTPPSLHAPHASPSPQPPTPSPDFHARLEKCETDIADLRANKQDRGDYLRVGDLNGYAKTNDVPALEVIHGRIEERIHELRPGLLSGMSFGKLVAGALGLSSPVALAVIVASGLIGRKLRKRRGARNEDRDQGVTRSSPLAPRNIPVAIDSPPPPQQTVPETHFVPVEKDDFARAHQWASSQVARKYPGAAEMLSALDSLIKQQLAAK